MPFTAPYAAQFTKPLIRQIIAIIQRDMPSALTLVGGGYQSFLEYDLAVMPPNSTPQLVVVPGRVMVDESTEQTLERTQTLLTFLVTVGNQDPNLLAEQLQDYVRALSYVLDAQGSNLDSDQTGFYQALTLTLETLGTITTTPMTFGTVEYFRVIGHEYGALARAATGGFLYTAALTAKAVLIET